MLYFPNAAGSRISNMTFLCVMKDYIYIYIKIYIYIYIYIYKLTEHIVVLLNAIFRWVIYCKLDFQCALLKLHKNEKANYWFKYCIEHICTLLKQKEYNVSILLWFRPFVYLCCYAIWREVIDPGSRFNRPGVRLPNTLHSHRRIVYTRPKVFFSSLTLTGISWMY